MSELYAKSWLDQHEAELSAWQMEAFKDFKAMINDEGNMYPCIPGRHGFLSDNLRFGFVGDPEALTTPLELAALLKQYGQCSRETGKYASLVVFSQAPPALAGPYTVQDYEQIFWTLLNRISQHDEKEWPQHISTDPAHASWEFCFDGHPYFTFCATPAHTARKSRHFSTFLLAFQPRWVFEEINDSTVFGRKMKQAIRSRLVEYDGIPAHPSLNWYGQKDNLEWKQYFLRDDQEAPSRCPFSRIHSLK
ncbi:YqcI/YcgG family protein [Paenibacillus eucommiae]|uniref:FPC/CPF motif-containing protein YcgG n=1 Tax=Paenibacillus eucommiae TaxID=1355755 RepID=A0ABS4J0L4_9BACL|nr:YqcI/YcgG family protein [Paenibacillus eucommiae]MBP1993378.1 FPC/CPF motif-containing protein YcgG [Paenibacillus eucommiae]